LIAGFLGEVFVEFVRIKLFIPVESAALKARSSLPWALNSSRERCPSLLVSKSLKDIAVRSPAAYAGNIATPNRSAASRVWILLVPDFMSLSCIFGSAARAHWAAVHCGRLQPAAKNKSRLREGILFRLAWLLIPDEK
jgi:hypothetical protein